MGRPPWRSPHAQVIARPGSYCWSVTPTEIEKLASIRTIDLTTYGRRTGEPHRIEIWWFRVGDRFIITGTPGRRDWMANVKANPKVVVHVDGWDIEATASVVSDRTTRREVFTQAETKWYSSQAGLDRLIREAPMIEVHIPRR